MLWEYVKICFVCFACSSPADCRAYIDMVIKTNDAQTAHILWLPSMSQSQVLYATCLRRFQRLRLLLLSFKARSLCKVVAMPWVTVKGKTITTVCFVSAPLSKRTRERTSSFWTEMQDFCHRSRRSHMREYAIMDCGHFAVTELIWGLNILWENI